MKKVLFLSLSLILGISAAHAQDSKRSFPAIGVDLGGYFPTSSRTKDVFGSSWLSVGPGIGSTLVSRKGITPDLSFTDEKKSGNKAFAAIVGARYQFPLGQPFNKNEPPSFAPYAAFSANVVYAKVDAPSVAVDDKSLGVGAGAFVGASFGPHFFAEAGYRALSRTAKFNLSGAQLTIGARF